MKLDSFKKTYAFIIQISVVITFAVAAKYPSRIRNPLNFVKPALPLIPRGIRGGGDYCMAEKSTVGKSEGSVLFYTNKKCPYAQRVWIALEEKDVKYSLVEIALYGSGGKPDWFLEMNPKGEVPVLKHGENVIVESNDIIRYIDQNFEPRNLLQLNSRSDQDSIDWFIHYVSKNVLPKDKTAILSRKPSDLANLSAALEEMEARACAEGPFLLGGTFTLADVTAIPMFQRMATEAPALGLLPARLPRLCRWIDAALARPAVARTATRDWWWWW